MKPDSIIAVNAIILVKNVCLMNPLLRALNVYLQIIEFSILIPDVAYVF